MKEQYITKLHFHKACDENTIVYNKKKCITLQKNMRLLDLFKRKPKFRLLYFYGSNKDDLASKLFGKSLADVLVSKQNERFRVNPPSIPVDMIDIGNNKYLVNKYHVQAFPSFYLVNEDGEVLKEWRGELTGKEIDNYIQNLKK